MALIIICDLTQFTYIQLCYNSFYAIKKSIKIMNFTKQVIHFLKKAGSREKLVKKKSKQKTLLFLNPCFYATLILVTI